MSTSTDSSSFLHPVWRLCKSFLNQIERLGVHDGIPYPEQRRIILTNRLVAGTLPLVLLITILSLSLGQIGGTLIGGSMAGILLLTFWMNSRQFFLVGRWILVAMFIGLITTLVVLFGRGSGGYMTYLAIGVGIVLMFGTWKHRILLLCLLALGFSVSEIFLAQFEPLLIEQVSTWTYPVTFCINFISLVILMVYFGETEKRHALESDQLLRAAQQKQKEAELVKADLEQFTIAASHQLKTPLRNIHSFLGLIDRRLPKEAEPDLREFLGFAQDNSMRMEQLLRDLLQFTEVSQSPLPAHLPEINLNDLLRKWMLHWEEQHPDGSYQLIVDDLPLIVMETPFARILFSQLITNGFTYNQSDQPRIHIRGESTPNGASILIQDNGVGIPEFYQEKAFELFSRLHTIDQFEGTGLGLAISRKIVERYGGSITIQESSPLGTTLHLYFPFDQSS